VPLAWSIKWDSRALKDVAEIPKSDRMRIVDAVDRLATDPLKGKPLKGRWKGLRRIRVGVYRIIYALRNAELTILVLRVGSRSGVYR
jgi:mRNA interferase RelE/StbE